MNILVASLSTGKGTWGHVSQVIKNESWDKIILVSNEFGKENYKPEKAVEYVIVDQMSGIKDIRDRIYNELKEKINDLGDVALNIVSGEGKEHMAMIAALLKLGFGIRLVAATKDGIEEI